MWPFSTVYPEVPSTRLNEQYDYIIVGGGTAGCVLARRLSEDRQASVLLVERGSAADAWYHRWPLLSHYWANSRQAIALDSDPSPHLGRSISFISGVGLGGGSRVNATLYTCGVPGDYNAWGEESGFEGWAWKDLLPYFMKAECLADDKSHIHYGTDGPWQIRIFTKFNFGISSIFIKAAERLGLSSSSDGNDPTQPSTGVFRMHNTIDQSGWRNSTNRAFIPTDYAIDHTENLHVCTHTIVRKVEFDTGADDGLVATGVQLQGVAPGSPTVFVRARREVIVCAGALRSPQILMLSGIGPKEHLEDVGIPVVKDLPGVGSRLQDHLGVSLDYNCRPEDSLIMLFRSPRIIVAQLYEYLVHGTGWLTSSTLEACALSRAELIQTDGSQRPLSDAEKNPEDPANVPVFEVMGIAMADPRPPEFDRTQGTCAFLISLLRPASAGTVRLRSSDPLDAPLCAPNYLAARADRASFRAAVRFCSALADRVRADGYPLRGVKVPAALDDETIDRFVEQRADTHYHYAGTCRMAREERGGAVDGALRVHGVRGLRMCDASVFPRLPATHLQAPVVAVAERCADLVKEAWKERE